MENKKTSLTILHTNDTHGKVEAQRKWGLFDVGGVVFRSSLINEIRHENNRKENHHTMLLDGGDILENDPMSHFYKGEPDILAMNHMKYDATTIGNHELGFTIDAFKKLDNLANFPFLSCNLRYLSDEKLIGIPYIIKEINGIKIGILGVTSYTVLLNVHKNDLGNIIYEEAESTIKKYMAEIKNEGIDYLILLSHLGIEEDREIAEKIDGIDVIIGSHSHTFIHEAEIINDTKIVQAGRYSEAMGRIELEFTSKKCTSFYYRLMPVGDNELGKIIKPYHEELCSKIDVPIGTLKEELNSKDKYTSPAALNQYVIQLMIDETGADFGMETAISIMGNLGPGNVTMRDIYEIMPFDNFVTTVKINGRELKELLEYRSTTLNTMFYTQVQGIEFTNKTETEYKIKGEEIIDEKVYTMVTDNYLVSGGCKDPILPNLKEKNVSSVINRDLLIKAISQEG